MRSLIHLVIVYAMALTLALMLSYVFDGIMVLFGQLRNKRS